MSTKKYCFVPEPSKNISVYNAQTITDLKTIDNVNPNVKFRYCIDDYDKIKMFYIGPKSQSDGYEEEEYFRYKTLQSIKSIFKVDEIVDYEIFLDDDARIEFSIWYDVNGNHVHSLNLVEKNKSNTLLKHQYRYNFYKRYNA